MARQVLPIVGAIVGAYFGNPQLGYAIGAMIGNAVDPQVINGPKLGEGQENKASEGGYRPIVLGKGRVGVCMINQGPLIKRTIRHRQSKGGGPITTEERFYRTMAFAVGEPADVGTGVQLLRMWVDGKLSYDATPTSQIVAESAEFAEKFTFYQGTMDQQPDPDLEAYMGAGNVSAYQGAPYIVFPHYDVTQAGGRAPVIHVEIASLATSDLRIGDSVEATHLMPGAPESSYAVGDGAGGIQYISAQETVSVGGTYKRVNLDSGLNVKSSADVEWMGNGVGINLLEVRAMSKGGFGISYDGAFGYCKSFSDGVGAGNFQPSDTSNVGWWFAEAQRSPEYGGLIWFGDDGTWFLGIRSTGPSGSYMRRLIKFSQSMSVDEPELALVTDVGSSVSPYFYMSRSRDGNIHVLDLSGLLITYSPNLSIIASRDLGIDDFSNHSAVGFGVDGDLIMIYSSGSAHYPSGLYFYRIGDPTIIKHVPAIGGSGVNTRVIFESGSLFVQRGRNLLKVDYDPGSEVVAGKIPLSSIVSWLHDRVNFTDSKYDVSQLTDLVEGVVFGDGYTAADAIRAAGGWYFFDAGEFDGGSGYRIHYVKRGAGAVATLTDLDIVDGPEDWEREDSYERPRVLHVAYQNPVMDYGAPTIPIKRTSPDVLVVGERSLSVPFVHSDQDEVARRGDIAMTVAYTEIAGKYEVVLPVDWLSLAPTDTIGFSIRGRTRRLRMVSWRFSTDGTIKTEWMADRQSAYTSDLTALPPTPTTPPPPSIVGPTFSAVLDIPALTDSLDSLHLILAASGQTPAWWGSIHQRRLEAETDFSTAMVFSPPTTIMGALSDGVSAASPHYTDTTNVVRVTLYSDDELDTHTQQQFLSENGAFALSWDDGGTRRWEILQYRDAVKVGDQEWELSTLSRGRLDTTTAPHPAGSVFVLLDVGVRAAPAQVSWIGQDIEHRAVSNGQQPDQAVPYSEEYTGQSQREWPVAHLFGSIDGDSLRLTCVPRHRFGTDDNPVQSINHDGYRWTATDGSSSATADTAAPSHTFDVTGWGTPITVTVAQLNRITGEGPTVSETINA